MAKGKRFEVIESEASFTEGTTKVLKDKETGVLYLYHNNGLTLLVDMHGKPILDKPEQK